jgi:hypothetical protein
MKQTENKKEIGNTRSYVYEQGTKVEIDGFVITDLIQIFDTLVNEEIKSESKFKFNYVNEGGKIVKSPKKEDIEVGKVKKILDFDRTIMNPTMEYTISQKGIAYAELKNFLESLHYQNIQNGKAVNYQELMKKQDVEPSNEEKKD